MTHAVGFTYAIYANITAGWTNITSDVISGTVRGLDGMESNRHLDRVGQIGEFSFELRNNNGYYSPGHVSALAGWDSGIEMRLVMSYDYRDYTFYGRIAPAPEGIVLDAGSKMPRAKVTVTDFFDIASTYPIVNPGIQTNKTGAQILTQALASMPVQPLSTEFDATVNTFAYAFDTITSKTKVYGELSKVVFSELGYGYMLPDGTLVLESATCRSGLDTETPIPVVSLLSGRGLREDGGFELREDGGYELRDETEVLNVAGTQLNVLNDGYGIDFGVNLLNRVPNYAYPRKLDTSPVVLFRLSQVLAISPGQTITIKGTFADPAGGLPVNGQNMITPVPTTDYLFNTAADGSGTDQTVDIALISPTYGTEGFTHQVKNNGSYFGYLIQYNTRGYGIYQYNPLEHTAQNATSIAARSVKSDTLHQKYQQSPAYGALFTDAWVEAEKHPETRINRIRFCANYSPTAMNAALNIRVGSLIRLQETRTAKDAYFYVQGREWELLEGKILMMSWVVKEMLNLTLGLSLIGVTFSGSTDAIRHGYVPWLSNLTERSHSVWIYPTSAPGDIRVIMGTDAESGNGGGVFRLDWDGQRVWLTTQYNNTGVGSIAAWRSDVLPLNVWYHIVITHAENDTTATAAKIYINGVAGTFSRVLAGNSTTGIMWDETDAPFTIGNATAIGTDNAFPGSILAPRIYNRQLTATEIANLYAAGPDAIATVTSGLVYQGFCVPTAHKADYIGVLTNDDRLRDNIYGIVGEPIGAPVGFETADNAPTIIGTTTVLTANNASSASGNHTIPAGTDAVLILAANRNFRTISTITLGSQSAIKYQAQNFTGSNKPRIEIWYILNPTPGTFTATITESGATWSEYAIVNLDNVANASVATMFANYNYATGTGTAAAVSIGSEVNHLAIDITSSQQGLGTFTAGAGQTVIMDASADTDLVGGASSKPGSFSTVSFGWTLSIANDWISAAVSIRGTTD